MVSIYILSDPITLDVRYVGKTSVLPASRYSQHIYQWKRCEGKMSHLNCWIKSLALKELKPILQVIRKVSMDEWESAETFYIKLFRDLGYDLVNATDGGEGSLGYKHSEESLNKRLESLKTSIPWKEKHERHSKIMKQKHKEGNTSFGYAHLPESERIKIGERHSVKMKQVHSVNPNILAKAISAREIKVESINSDGTKLEFDSISKAARFYEIEPTYITRVCKGKSKSGLTHGIAFKYV